MFQIQEDSMHRLMKASQHLHGSLVSSPLWEMLKTEPVIVQWISALNEVESQIKPKEPLDVTTGAKSSSQSKT